jgi:hypothetical protein
MHWKGGVFYLDLQVSDVARNDANVICVAVVVICNDSR